MPAFDLLSTLFEVETYKAKDLIFCAGDQGEKFYVVCEGCVKITSKDVKEGKETTLSMLTKDTVFGEIALLEETTRTATALAFEPCLLLSTTREKFNSLLDVFPKFGEIMKPLLADRTSNTLKHVSFFKNLSKESRTQVGHMTQFTSYLTGMTVVKEGDRDDGLYILVEGTIRVTSGGKHLGVLSEGDVMGEVALLGNCRRTATLITEEPCRMLHMSCENCKRLMGVVPEILESMIALTMSRRVRSVEVLGEENLGGFPLIDQTSDSKLHLYGLLRNSADLDHVDRRHAGKNGAITELQDEEKKELEVESNNLQLESQFLDIQIFDLLTCIKVLEKQVQVQRTIEDLTLAGSHDPSRKSRRNSWPPRKNNLGDLEEYEYNQLADHFTPKSVARKVRHSESRSEDLRKPVFGVPTSGVSITIN